MAKSPRKMRLLRLLLVVLGVVLVVSYACHSWVERRALVVATVSRDWFNAPMILSEPNWDTREHPVRTFDLNSGLASKNAVLSGAADVGLSSPIVLLRDPRAWEELVLLGVYMRSDAVVGMVTNGAELTDTISKIGLVRGTISEVYLTALNATVGGTLLTKASDLIDIQPPTADKLIARGHVDAVVIWEPHLSRAKFAAGPNAQLIAPENIYRVHVALITSRAALRENPDGVRAVSEAVQASCNAILQDPASARGQIESELNLEPALLERAWKKVDFRYTDMRDELREILEREAGALQDAALLSTTAQSSNYFQMLRDPSVGDD